MSMELLQKIRRGLRKPPRVIAERIAQELQAEAERFISPMRARRLDRSRLLRELGCADIKSCWEQLASHPYAAVFRIEPERYEECCPGDRARILAAAELALAHKVDLLGSGLVDLGPTIDWHRDYKTGYDWPPAYFRSIEYSNLERPSDVKFPWEVSRLQWLIPAGQAYVLTGDERYAEGVRRVLEQWMAANPYAHSVNWTCTMEVALRILSWTWLFHACHRSAAWADEGFRTAFLRMLYLHGDFTARHLERSDINGNHYTADAAGLVFAGLFFGEQGRAAQWHELGWQILCDELPKQVFPDGVDYEASVPYHRLVLELFLFPALYRIRRGYAVPSEYRERLRSMARFTEAYTRADGSVPLWGDADDARALPFGGQAINDHRYLPALVGQVLQDGALQGRCAEEMAEACWWFGVVAVSAMREHNVDAMWPSSRAFGQGGFYVMRNDCDHVFIDCGPLGLAGRGGHGHNDALSFEAALCGITLVVDSGAYLYTADYRARNRFRSTASHNTPMVDGEEINRFIRPDYLWNLLDDARPELLEWRTGEDEDRFCGRHSGYARLAQPVIPMRTITLHHANHRLEILDEFQGEGDHEFEMPLHFAPGVVIAGAVPNGYLLSKDGLCFELHWEGGWTGSMEDSACSPSYGRLCASRKIVWRCRTAPAAARLKIVIQPREEAAHG